LKDVLQIFARMSDSNGNVRFMSYVGAGSSEQCLVEALATSLLISSAVTSSKAGSLTEHLLFPHVSCRPSTGRTARCMCIVSCHNVYVNMYL